MWNQILLYVKSIKIKWIANLKGNYNFATNVISTEKVRNKTVEEVRRKMQPYFFPSYPKFNPNYIRIRKGWEQGLGLGRGFDFTIQSIFWNNFFTGKSLLNQSKYMAPPNKHLTSWSINNAKKLINIALEILRMFKVVKPTIFLMKFDTKQAWCEWG